ncbi:MAG: pseudaminic acid cytidylyltransferase [Lachnospira sp.]|jgi:N-acylneuraminate cytidylyltransferase|nr:pseudaminic acid cytidylyltransferase [Lachnospira sp.]
MKNVAIITARGGSKRIPHKNIKLFCGKPIIQYSIEAAVQLEIFDEVMVSTDDEQIKQIAIELGAKVPFMRSESTSNDYATTADVLNEVLFEYENSGMHFDHACCIYPTAPFITKEKLEKAYHLLVESHAESVIPVVAYSFPPQRGFALKDDRLSYLQPENAMKRSQDLETIYHDCGQFYFFRVDQFLKSKKLVTNTTRAIVMNELEVQDIDNESDWNIAEMKYQIMQNKMV